MDTPVPQISEVTTPLRGRADAPATPPGSTVGRYIAIAEVGRGGMGVVLRGYDPKLQREVAIKLLRADAMSEESHARLVREARAMARLNHPNVVAIHDVDDEPGQRVALVMEYVEGTTLSQWLRACRRPWREVVMRHVAAGRGLAAAHGVGLLHRDFKPANVLVGEDGRVRVTDFGLARGAVNPEPDSGRESSPADTIPRDDALSMELTHAGVVLGTPAYMAPEQEHGDELSPAADQYAFCVSLWEGLTGARPFFGTATERRRLKRSGAPPWPRDVQVPRAIVTALERGLAPDPARRFADMDALLAVLEREATPRPLWRWTAFGGATLAVAIGVAIAGLRPAGPQPCSGARAQLGEAWDGARASAVQAALLGTEVAYAELAWSRLRSALDAYSDTWMRVHTEACEATSVRGERSSAMLDAQVTCLAHARVELDATTRLLARADANMVARAHEMADGLPALTRCEDMATLGQDVPAPDEDARAAVDDIRGRLAEARAASHAGKHDEADRHLDAVRERVGHVGYEPLEAEVLLESARTRLWAADFPKATQEGERALQLALRWNQWRLARAAAYLLVDLVSQTRRDFPRGHAYAATAGGLATRDDADDRERADYHQTMAWLLESEGEGEHAEVEARAALALRQRGLPAEDPEVAQARATLALVLMARGELAQAEAEQRVALGHLQAALGETHPTVTLAYNNLGAILITAGDFAQAEPVMRRVLVTWTQTLGERDMRVVGVHHNLGIALYHLGSLEEAERESRAALAGMLAVVGPEHANVADVRFGLADVLAARQQLVEAEEESRTALRLREQALGAEHMDVAHSHAQLFGILVRAGRVADAREVGEAAVATLERTQGADHADTKAARDRLQALQDQHL